MKRVRALLGACLIGSGWACAGPPALDAERGPLYTPRFEVVGAAAIPRDVVGTLAQDRAGFLWIATGDGLVRYDGYRFRPQERDSPEPAARNLGWIRALWPARDGRLWIGTETDGLAVYDPATDRVTTYRSDGQAAGPGAVPLPMIAALAEDSDGAIWVGIAGGGLQRFDPKTMRFTTYRTADEAGSLPHEQVTALRVDRRGVLWIGTWQGLSRRLPGQQQVERVALPPPSPPPAGEASQAVTALFESADGRLWIGTQRGQVWLLEGAERGGSGDAVAAAAGPPPDAGAGPRGAVTSFAEVPGGRVWVGHARGIDLHDAASGRWLQRLRHDPGDPGSLAGDEVTALVVDRTGWVWAGGIGVGLQRHHAANRSLWVRGRDRDPASPLAAPNVRSLFQLDNGEIWAGMHSGRVAVLDRELRVVGSLDAAAIVGAGAAPLPVEAITQAADGSVWLGVDSAVVQVDRRRRVLRRVAHTGGGTVRLLADADGTLWIGARDGLYRLAAGAATPTRVGRQGGQPLVGGVFTLGRAPDQTLFVGGINGLHRLPVGAAELAPVASGDGAGLGNPIVLGLLFDRDGTLWVDTAVAGLHRTHDWGSPRVNFERISERHGIVSRPFGANLLADDAGRVWTHMHVYDPGTDHVHTLTDADGVRIGTGWFFSYARLDDGRLLFGGTKGLLVVRGEGFESVTDAPPVVVSELRIDGVRSHPNPLDGSVTLEPGHRSVAVEFAALDFRDPQRIGYAYQLTGFDPDWVRASAQGRVASYSNLDPGRYLLRVRATDNMGGWSPHELALAVHVVPAWWQLWWVRLLPVALLLLGVYALLQLRTRRLRQRQAELETKVRERTQELQQLASALEESSVSDPLTGLRNRRFLTRHIEAETALTVRRHQAQTRRDGEAPVDADLIFFMIDIDYFKQVNDTHGHEAGDDLLVQFRQRLQPVFRDTDYLVRWGGEEFLVLARNTSRQHAADLAERVRAAVADEPFGLPDGGRLQMTCSLGFACFPLCPQQPAALDWTAAVKTADAALYAVKRAGRNGWLGLRTAEAASAGELQDRMRGSLAEWWRSGTLDLVHSATLAPWERRADAPETGGD